MARGERAGPDPRMLRLHSALCRGGVILDLALAGDPATKVRETVEVGVLLVLTTREPLRPREVSALAGLSSGGTSKLLDRMEHAGLIERTYGELPEDRRAVTIRITDDGRRAVDAAEGLIRGIARELVPVLGDLVELEAATSPRSRARSAPPDRPAGSILEPLFEFITIVDFSVIDVIGPDPLLHPRDPRPLLVLIESAAPQGLAMADVAALIGRSPSAANALIGHLEADGLVARHRGSVVGDRRIVTVRSTPAGQRLLHQLVDALAAALPDAAPAAQRLLDLLDPVPAPGAAAPTT
jgi:DNA-binding MarR family transcriptional regulator